jgi:hypothetical protein
MCGKKQTAQFGVAQVAVVANLLRTCGELVFERGDFVDGAD